MAIAHELRTCARVGGEPVGLEADLRAATSQAEERRIRARIADQQAATDRRLDEVEAASAIASDQIQDDAGAALAAATEYFTRETTPRPAQEALVDLARSASRNRPEVADRRATMTVVEGGKRGGRLA